MMSRLVTAAAVAALVASPALPQSADPSIGSGNIDPSMSWVVPQSPAARRGMAFVRVQCARCHAVDRSGASPLATAPRFPTLHLKYPVADLQRPLAEGIHPAMPRFRLTAGQLADVMAYLKTLEKETSGM
jgi:mono/diheme cytochrome c family protein